MLLGTTLFSLHMFGLGQQYLWPEWPALQRRISPLAVLLALSPASLFVALTLDTRCHSPRLHRLLLALSAVTGLGLLLGAFDQLSYPTLKALTSVTGLAVALVATLASWQQAREGNRAAAYMLVGWGTYAVGGLGMVSLLYGLVPVTVGTMHAFQAGWLLEMLAWLQVLGLYVERVRLQAERSELDQQAMQSLAHTDPLTGLPNRRGLGIALQAALPGCGARRQLAVYMLDLDGVKRVNDALGHDAGDALLVAAAHRLRQELPRLAPQDGLAAAALLKQADAAMYAC